MNETLTTLLQPPAYRVWDLKYRSFFYTDVQPEPTSLHDRWTGLFDKQGQPIYEHDIIRAHYNWKFGWVRALVTRHAERHEYRAQATDVNGAVLSIGYYSFADAYRVGNIREHPGRLVAATEQFAAPGHEPWWLSSAVFRTLTPASCN